MDVKKLLKLANKFNKVIEYKTNIKKQPFLHNNNKLSERK